MNLRACIFDVYGTLLEVRPPPPEADARWRQLWRSFMDLEPRMDRLAFSVECSRIVKDHHERSRRQGIPWPEIWWPSIVAEAVPEVRLLPSERIEAFAAGFVALSREIHLAPGAIQFLKRARERSVLLGIASNAQRYTLGELDEALRAQGLGMSIFDPHLQFWSFEHGFSKPDPHVFQSLTLRLESRGIAPAEVLMIGDRMDNDIEPARRHGWRAWQYQPSADRNWEALCRWLNAGNRARQIL